MNTVKFTKRMIFASLVAISVLHAEQAQWETITREAGITVQRQEIEDSNYVIFRGMGVVSAPLVEILATLADYSSHKDWIGNSLGSREVQRVSEKSVVFYTATEAPWPLKDRDFVGISRMTVDKKNKMIIMRSREYSHPDAPPRTDRQRMPFVRVTWIFKPMQKYKGKRTWVSFQVQADPGGIIPSWAANLVAKKIPFDTISGLRRRLAAGQVNQEFVEQYSEYKDWY